MTTKTGYSAVLNGSEVYYWDGEPEYFEYLNGGTLIFRFKASRRKSAIRGTDGNIYQILERHSVDKPTRFHTAGVDSMSISTDGERVIVDHNWSADVGVAKSARKNELRIEAKSLLEPTDFVVMASLESENSLLLARNSLATGSVAYRSAIRGKFSQRSLDIDALSTANDVASYVATGWPV